MAHLSAADHAWWLEAERQSNGWATELAEFHATHPRPQLKVFLVGLAGTRELEPTARERDRGAQAPYTHLQDVEAGPANWTDRPGHTPIHPVPVRPTNIENWRVAPAVTRPRLLGVTSER
jgi:hypothetical protein